MKNCISIYLIKLVTFPMGIHDKIQRAISALCLELDVLQNFIFLCWKIFRAFFCHVFTIFWGYDKFSAIFWVFRNLDNDSCSIFQVGNLSKFYLSALASFLRLFVGFAKFPLFLGGLTNFQLYFSVFQFFCITHLSHLIDSKGCVKTLTIQLMWEKTVDERVETFK